MTTLADRASGPPSLFAGRHRFLTAGLLLVVTLVAFESMAVTTVMPIAVRELHGMPLYAWGFSAFYSTSLLANVVGGVWSDARGPALPILTGLGTFVTGLLIAGVAPWMWLFVLGRAVQGFGGGAVIVALYVVIAREYDEAARPRMFAWVSGAWVLPSLLGPFLGGAVAQYLHWRWVFLGLIPLVLPGVLMLAPVLRPTGRVRVPDGSRRSLSAVAVAVGAASLLYAADRHDLVTLAPAAAGLLLLTVGLPKLVPAGTLRLRRGLPTAVALRGLMPAAFAGTSSFLSLTMIRVHGFSPTLAGIAITVGSLGWSVGSWYQGRTTLPVSRNRLIMIAVGLLTLGIALATTAGAPAITGWITVPAWVIAGIGMGIGMSSLNVMVMRLSAPARQGANAAATQVCEGLGSSLAVGFAGALVTAFGSHHLPPGLIAGGALMALLALLGTLAAARL